MANASRQSQNLSSRNRTSRIVTALAVIGFGSAVFALPFWYVRNKKNQNVNLYAKSGPLSPAEKMRGAYMNVGSKDIGPDPEYQRRIDEIRRTQQQDSASSK